MKTEPTTHLQGFYSVWEHVLVINVFRGTFLLFGIVDSWFSNGWAFLFDVRGYNAVSFGMSEFNETTDYLFGLYSIWQRLLILDIF
jgi:hypothetical protein